MNKYTDTDYLPAYGMTRAELDNLNERVCEVAGLSVEKCPTNNYHEAMTALTAMPGDWSIDCLGGGYVVMFEGAPAHTHALLCVAICKAIAGKGKHLDCDTPTIRDAEGRVVHRAGNDRTYMPGDDMPEM